MIYRSRWRRPPAERPIAVVSACDIASHNRAGRFWCGHGRGTANFGWGADSLLLERNFEKPPLASFLSSSCLGALCGAPSADPYSLFKEGAPMFDSIGAFTKQFVPTEGGYLYYPTKKAGGKLVTVDEYEQLAAGWRRIAGRRGIWTVACIVMLAGIVGTAISRSFSLPDWSDSIIVAASVISLSAWFLWASFSPRRLVRDRPTVAPPRPASEANRQARASLNWRFIIFALLFSGVAFLGSLDVPERGLGSWAWLIGSGVFFVLCIWIAIQKFRDR